MHAEEDFGQVRAEADQHGMVDDIDIYSSFFDPDYRYPVHDPIAEEFTLL